LHKKIIKWLKPLTVILTLMICMSVFSIHTLAVEVDAETEMQTDETVAAVENEQNTIAEIESEPVETYEPIYGEPPELAEGSLPVGTGFRPFTPSGSATVIDNATGADGKEFFTIMTEAENVFYLIIDRQRNTENVYFLNAVTEADLLALVKTEEVKPASSTTTSRTPAEQPETQGTVTPEPATPTETPMDKSSSPGLYIFLGIAVLVFGGAAYYFKIAKPKKDAIDDTDDYEDEYDYDAESDDDDDLDNYLKEGDDNI